MKLKDRPIKNSFIVETKGSEATKLEAYIHPEDDNIYFNMIDFYGDKRRITLSTSEFLNFINKIILSSTSQ